MRWESQNHIADHNDWAPRVAFAYALDGHKDKKQAKTVLRGGYGFFYDRLPLSDLLAAERFSGAGAPQQQTVIYNPTCFSATSLPGNPQKACNPGLNPNGTPNVVGAVDRIAPDYRSPVTQQLGTSLERQLTKATTLTFTYLHSFGVHQMVTRNANAPYVPGYNVSAGNVDEYDPEAVFKQNQMIVNVNAHITPNFSLIGFYNLTAANTDSIGGIASNSADLMQDYGRANWASRQMVFMMANYQGPWGIRFNPFLIALSGKPYNIVTNADSVQDGFFNHRPAKVSSDCSTTDLGPEFVQTSFGCLDTTPADTSTLIPADLGNSPAAVAMNLRISRAFGLGPKLESANAGAPPPGGGGSHGGHGGGFGGPFGGGGGRGGPGGIFGPTNTGRKYTLTFNAQALNLFNDIDRGTPVGTIAPPPTDPTNPGSLFGQSTSLAGGIFSSGAAARRIFLQATFSF